MINFTDMDIAGLLPMFFDERDPRSAKEQLDENYAHGGGARPFQGFELNREADLEKPTSISYEGDPDMNEITRAKLRDETLILYEGSWLAVIQPSGTYEIYRVD